MDSEQETHEDQAAAARLKKLTPSNEELRRRVRANPPHFWLKQAKDLQDSLQSQRNPAANLLQDKRQRKIEEAIIYLKSVIDVLQCLKDLPDLLDEPEPW